VVGNVGPSSLYLGVWSALTEYIGSETIVQAVYYNSLYYITRSDAGVITAGTAPTESAYWNPYGATFESIATGTLLAQGANIANFIFNDGRMESQAETNGVPNIILDGVSGSGQFGGGNIKLNADGTIEYTGKISSSTSGKRIIIDPAVNSIKMIDSSNREVMVANFGDVPNFSTAYIYLNGYSGTETTPSRYATISPSSAQLYHSGSAMFSLSIASNGGVNMITDLSKMPTVAGSIGQWYRSGEYIKIKTS